MTKEKTIVELKERSEEIRQAQTKMIELAKTEKRKLTDKETAEFDNLSLEARDVASDIAYRKAMGITTASDEKAPAIKTMSVRKMILDAANGSISEDTAAISGAAKEEMRSSGLTPTGSIQIPVATEKRAMSAGSATGGGNTIETDRMAMLMPLQDNLVLAKAGAKIMTGLVGNVEFPSITSASSAWVGETTGAGDAAITTPAPITFSPLRIATTVTISKQLLIQSSEDVESYVRDLMIKSISAKLQSTLLGKEAATTTKPAGLFAGTIADAGDMTWERLVGMETALATANADITNAKYIMHPALFGKGKTTLRAEGVSGFLVEGNPAMTNSYLIERTNAIAKGLQTGADEYGIAFGNWNDYFIGQWGALDITVDNITLASSAQIKITINSWWNGGKLRNESFAIASAK